MGGPGGHHVNWLKAWYKRQWLNVLSIVWKIGPNTNININNIYTYMYIIIYIHTIHTMFSKDELWEETMGEGKVENNDKLKNIKITST
jgi:hypothetical protein